MLNEFLFSSDKNASPVFRDANKEIGLANTGGGALDWSLAQHSALFPEDDRIVTLPSAKTLLERFSRSSSGKETFPNEHMNQVPYSYVLNGLGISFFASRTVHA